ncbi:MAG: bifunctional acetaldehyde-CoA/alcohol dehydrogenase [Defluviitaleaceae bacterium]|nr:bifunctional acetaldehyde-CoA/alcohol dehydrogenase [Defluviitaleaceae bacterium]
MLSKKTYGITDTPELLGETLERVKAAQKVFSGFDQEKIDAIFKAVALAANHYRLPLAKLAVEETGMGILEDKVIKNHYATEYIYNKYKNVKTVGVIEEDTVFGTRKIAEPVGVIAGVIPTTNPTSTSIFKILISLKTRNGIILAPHPRAKKCVVETAKILLEAAVAAGAPENIIGWIDTPSIDLTQMIMKESDFILATGGPGMVKSAYSSGTPAVGVGSGNVPALIDSTANIKVAVNSIIHSKTFDNGMICASEQSVIVVADVYDEVKIEFEKRNSYILGKKEADKVRKIIVVDGHLNGKIVGQPAYKIAEMAGIEVPKTTKILIAEVESTDWEEEFSHEKLSPVLALYKGSDFDDALEKADAILNNNGLGHTSSIHIHLEKGAKNLRKFEERMKSGRIVINQPSSHGGIGDLYNFKLAPSLTLGCGTWGGNSVSENVGVGHLLNIKTVTERKENMLWFRVPPKIYFKRGSLPIALDELIEGEDAKKRIFIVTDNFLLENGNLSAITDKLMEMGIQYSIFSDVETDPTLATVKKGTELMRGFNPDCIVAFGGGSPMDVAKIMWLLYEHPEVDFFDMAMRFMDIRKRVYTFPKMGKKASFIAIPTTAGTGAEVTPFAVITDEKTDVKYPIADYELTPHMAIVDSDLMMHMPKSLTAASGIDVLSHAIESYVSTVATSYTQGLSVEALRLVFKYLPQSYKEGADNPKARQRMADASTIAGMAFGNAFLGICHSLAHKLGATFGIPHGIANALLIEEVIRYNSNDTEAKMGTFSQYTHPRASELYAKLSDYLGLGGNTNEEKVENLIKKIRELKNELEIKPGIKYYGVTEKDFMDKVDYMAENAFDDQCTGANPRYPLIEDLKDIYIKAFNGYPLQD